MFLPIQYINESRYFSMQKPNTWIATQQYKITINLLAVFFVFQIPFLIFDPRLNYTYFVI